MTRQSKASSSFDEYLTSKGLWFLDGRTGEAKTLRRTPILVLPFLVGHRPGLGLTLPSTMISGRHAEIYLHGPSLRIRDLGSTNGTYVNGKRVVESTEVDEGDIVHFAKDEFRLSLARAEDARTLLAETVAVDAELPAQSRKKLISSVVSVASDLEIATIAEGIESDGEKSTCHRLGFSHGQGYLLGMPAPAAVFADKEQPPPE